jgi:hypothetical protein
MLTGEEARVTKRFFSGGKKETVARNWQCQLAAPSKVMKMTTPTATSTAE